MQPNLGQGGCMAIEDAYQLVLDLCHVSGSLCWGVKGGEAQHMRVTHLGNVAGSAGSA